MATYETAQFGRGAEFDPTQTQQILVPYTTAASSFATANDDVLKVVGLAKGAKLIDWALFCPDIDSNGTPTVTLTLEITDGTTTKTLLTASTVGQAGGVERPDAVAEVDGIIGWSTDNGDYWVQLKTPAAAATLATGKEINLMLVFTHDTGYNE